MWMFNNSINHSHSYNAKYTKMAYELQTCTYSQACLHTYTHMHNYDMHTYIHVRKYMYNCIRLCIFYFFTCQNKLHYI